MDRSTIDWGGFSIASPTNLHSSMSARREFNDFQWTVGHDDFIIHVSTLDRGANGEVHKVLIHLLTS